MKLLVGSLVVVVVLVGLFLFLWDPSAAAGDLEPQTGETAPEAAAQLRGGDATATEEADEAPGRVAVEPEAVAATAIDEGPTSAPPEHILVRGTITVIDGEGIEHGEEDGSFTLVRWRENWGSHADRVEVTAGRFEVEMLATEGFGLADLVLGDCPARVLNAYPLFEIDADTVLDVRAKWAPSVTLRVLDASTGLDLHGITVVRAVSRPLTPDEEGIASHDTIVGRDRSSPLVLTAEESGIIDQSSWRGRIWVHVPGYTWGDALFSLDEPLEKVVELQRAAELEVTLVNYTPPSDKANFTLVDGQLVRRDPSLMKGGREMQPRLRVRPAPDVGAVVAERTAVYESMTAGQREGLGLGTLAEEMDELRQELADNPYYSSSLVDVIPDPSGTNLVTGLPPGTYQVSAEVGNDWEDSWIVLAGTGALLEAGSRTAVTLTLDDLPDLAAPAPLAGTLRFPPAWGDLYLELQWSPVDLPGSDLRDWIRIPLPQMEPVAGDPGLYRWDAGEVVPGVYEARIDAMTLVREVEVPPGGNTTVHLEIAEPAEVFVRVVERATGNPAPVESISWHVDRGKRLWSSRPEYADPEGEVGEFRFRAPVGEVCVFVDTDEFSEEKEGPWEFRRYRIAPGQNELTLYVDRTCGLRITVEGAEEFHVMAAERHLVVQDESGEGAVVGMSGRVKTWDLFLARPGVHEVTFRGLGVYQDLEPLTIDVPYGEFVDLTLTVEKLE